MNCQEKFGKYDLDRNWGKHKERCKDTQLLFCAI